MSYEGNGAVVPGDGPIDVRQRVDAIPIISGEAYQHVGRYAGATVLAAFHQIGGVNRLASWADTNPTDFFTKLLPKIIQRSQSIDVTASVTIDDAISRLENAPLEGQFSRGPTTEKPKETFDL
jgi:hypothetical protein